jgi:hypothetical protein
MLSFRQAIAMIRDFLYSRNRRTLTVVDRAELTAKSAMLEIYLDNPVRPT